MQFSTLGFITGHSDGLRVGIHWRKGGPHKGAIPGKDTTHGLGIGIGASALPTMPRRWSKRDGNLVAHGQKEERDRSSKAVDWRNGLGNIS